MHHSTTAVTRKFQKGQDGKPRPADAKPEPSRKRTTKAAQKTTSAIVKKTGGRKITRPRKSPEIMAELCQLYYNHNGEIPPCPEIKAFAKKHGMTRNQIYKWFWDTKQKKTVADTLAS